MNKLSTKVTRFYRMGWNLDNSTFLIIFTGFSTSCEVNYDIFVNLKINKQSFQTTVHSTWFDMSFMKIGVTLLKICLLESFQWLDLIIANYKVFILWAMKGHFDRGKAFLKIWPPRDPGKGSIHPRIIPVKIFSDSCTAILPK